MVFGQLLDKMSRVYLSYEMSINLILPLIFNIDVHFENKTIENGSISLDFSFIKVHNFDCNFLWINEDHQRLRDFLFFLDHQRPY